MSTLSSQASNLLLTFSAFQRSAWLLFSVLTLTLTLNSFSSPLEE